MWHLTQLVLRKWQCHRLFIKFIKVSTHDGQAGIITPILDSDLTQPGLHSELPKLFYLLLLSRQGDSASSAM